MFPFLIWAPILKALTFSHLDLSKEYEFYLQSTQLKETGIIALNCYMGQLNKYHSNTVNLEYSVWDCPHIQLKWILNPSVNKSEYLT